MICQITALPRSGTAFIATMMNLGENCLAFHELFVTDPHWSATLREFTLRDLWPNQVVCDIGTYQYLPKAIIEDSKKIYIRQHPEKSRRRSQIAFGYDIPEAESEAWSDMAEKWVAKYNPLVIEQSELFNLYSLDRIWNYCNPHCIFPASKVALLLQMNIQRMNPKKVFAKDAYLARQGELWGS